MPASSVAARLRKAIATRDRKRKASFERWVKKPWVKAAWVAKAREVVQELKWEVSKYRGNAKEANRRADLVTNVLNKNKSVISALRPLAEKANTLEEESAKLKKKLEKAEQKNKEEAEKTRQEQEERRKTKDRHSGRDHTTLPFGPPSPLSLCFS